MQNVDDFKAWSKDKKMRKPLLWVVNESPCEKAAPPSEWMVVTVIVVGGGVMDGGKWW